MENDKKLFMVNTILSAATLILLAIMLVIFTQNTKSMNNTNANVSEGQKTFNKADIVYVDMGEALRVNIYSTDSDKSDHILYVKGVYGLDSAAKDYESVKKLLENEKNSMRSKITDIFLEKSYEEIKGNSKKLIQQEVLEFLNAEFATSCFVEIEFSDYFLQ